ncbi:hypothetical protein WMF31_13680 [Sorangium sp. So ce1036]
MLVLVRRAERRPEHDGALPRERPTGSGAVGEHEHVAALVVFEEVTDALLLEQARDEVEVALPVLHAVLPRAVAAAQREAVTVARDPGRAQDLLDDLRGGECLGDALTALEPRHAELVIQPVDLKQVHGLFPCAEHERSASSVRPAASYELRAFGRKRPARAEAAS